MWPVWLFALTLIVGAWWTFRTILFLFSFIIFIYLYFLFLFLFLLLSFIFIFIFIIIIMGSVRGVPGGGGRKRLVFAPLTGSASGVLLYGQIPAFFDIWAYNWISIHGPVIRANELLFEILRQSPGRAGGSGAILGSKNPVPI